MTADELIEEYKGLTKNCFQVDYGNKQAMKKNNVSVTRMYQIIETIKSQFGAEGIEKLKLLLNVSDFRTDLWIATHLLEKISLDYETERKALQIIENVAKSDDILALGYEYWMQGWKSKQNK